MWFPLKVYCLLSIGRVSTSIQIRSLSPPRITWIIHIILIGGGAWWWNPLKRPTPPPLLVPIVHVKTVSKLKKREWFVQPPTPPWESFVEGRLGLLGFSAVLKREVRLSRTPVVEVLETFFLNSYSAFVSYFDNWPKLALMRALCSIWKVRITPFHKLYYR